MVVTSFIDQVSNVVTEEGAQGIFHDPRRGGEVVVEGGVGRLLG